MPTCERCMAEAVAVVKSCQSYAVYDRVCPDCLAEALRKGYAYQAPPDWVLKRDPLSKGRLLRAMHFAGKYHERAYESPNPEEYQKFFKRSNQLLKAVRGLLAAATQMNQGTLSVPAIVRVRINNRTPDCVTWELPFRGSLPVWVLEACQPSLADYEYRIRTQAQS